MRDVTVAAHPSSAVPPPSAGGGDAGRRAAPRLATPRGGTAIAAMRGRAP